MYTHNDIRKTYEPIHEHRHTKKIIQDYAINQRDIREVALDGLDLSHVKDMLDLGCGYGFFTEGLKGRLDKSAHITGMDLIDRNNRESFLDTVNSIGYQGEFIQGRADLIREMKGCLFDLVVASYSLYFFPHVIPDIARVLKPQGIFITVTHSRYSLQEVTKFVPACMKKIGMQPPEEIMISKLFNAFSLEEGGTLLCPYFNQVEQIPYKNDLIFPFDQVDDCINYLDKKRHLIFKEVSDTLPGRVDDMISYFNRYVFEQGLVNGEIFLTKDDAVFRCFGPKK